MRSNVDIPIGEIAPSPAIETQPGDELLGHVIEGPLPGSLQHADNPTWRDAAGGVLDNFTPFFKAAQKGPAAAIISELPDVGISDFLSNKIHEATGIQLPAMQPLKTMLPFLQKQQFGPDYDPYKLVGTERMPINTLSGIVQTGAAIGMPWLGSRAILGRILKPVNLEKVALSVRKAHDVKLGSLENRFDRTAQGLRERGISFGGDPMVTTKSAKLNSILDEMEIAAGPEALEHAGLKRAASTGNPDAVHAYQKKMGEIERRHYKSPDNFHKGEYIHKKRDDLFDYMDDVLKQEGHTDLSDQISLNRNDYADFKGTFYPRKEQGIVKLVDPKTRELSSHTKNVFKKQNKYTEAVLNESPWAKREMNRFYMQQGLKDAGVLKGLESYQRMMAPSGILKGAKKLGKGLGIIGAGVWGANQIIDALTGGGGTIKPYQFESR